MRRRFEFDKIFLSKVDFYILRGSFYYSPHHNKITRKGYFEKIKKIVNLVEQLTGYRINKS